jgi:hypothetical protein
MDRARVLEPSLQVGNLQNYYFTWIF